jgi:photosystem II stability/assembly factor-like uncharacterized protein
MTGAGDAAMSFGQEAASSSSRGNCQSESEGREMLKRIVVCILAVVVIFTVGCKDSGDSSGGVWNLIYEASDDVYYSALCFPDENNGWVVGFTGRILHTSDGGTTWETQDSGTSSDLQCVCFTNVQTGCIGTRDGKIGRTTDGGSSWTWQEPLETNPERVFMAVCFVGDETGWIVDNTGNILHTEDGGTTWVPQDSGTDQYLGSVYFLNSEEGWATGMRQIFHTQDGGATWAVSDPDISLHPAVAILADIYFVDSENGWIATDINASSDSAAYESGGPLLHTTDGGNTWQVQASFPQEGRLSRVRFADCDTGWIVGSDDIFYTQDGGDSWSSQSISGGLFMDISFADPLRPWVLSFDGKVYRYTTD